MTDDHDLHETSSPTSARFPPLPPPARFMEFLNPLFVVMNAAIKFRRYKRMRAAGTALADLSTAADELIVKTTKLVELMY